MGDSSSGVCSAQSAEGDSPTRVFSRENSEDVPLEIQQIPLHNQLKNDNKSGKHNERLTIQVPKRGDRKEKRLANTGGADDSDPDVMDIDTSTADSDVARVMFEKITHLPTPVINNSGHFGDYPSSAMDSYDFEMSERRPSISTPYSKYSTRVVSDYRPSTVGEGSVQQQHKRKIRTRIVSTPISQSIGETVQDPDYEERENYVGRVIHSSDKEKTYKVVQNMGSGSFSTVALAVNIHDSSDKIVIKFLSIPDEASSQASNLKHFIKRELNILHLVRHPCIVRLVDFKVDFNISREELESTNFDSKFESDPEMKTNSEAVSDKNESMMFLEYCPGGNLFEFSFRSYNAYSHLESYWLIVERIVCELLSSVVYLHNNNVIHRDIKLENVLLNYNHEELESFCSQDTPFEKPMISLTDFGLSKRLKSADQLLTTRCGSQDYIAPEVLIGLKYNGRITDAWSVGVLIYALLENRLPFDVPPFTDSHASNISPSVLKRRRLKNNSSHRIAMIDWDWFVVNDLLVDENVNNSSKQIILRLKKIVDVLLVRKDMRLNLQQLVERDEFNWVSTRVPRHFIS